LSNQAWLALSKAADDYRRLVGSEHYDDDPASHYSWDSTVPNHGKVGKGDLIALWDLETLLGISVIESIERWPDTKMVGRCPNTSCGKASIEARKTLEPKYRCYDCGELFDEPTRITIDVTRYRSDHAESWVDLNGLLDAPTLRSLCVSPKSQNSFRPLNIEAFRAAVSAKSEAEVFQLVDTVSAQISGGHKEVPVRVRIGQAAFRAHLLKKYGEVCAFTGPAPKVVLDACHLYRYAKLSVHEDEGGLMLRRDLHSLFDQGLITVDADFVIHVAESVRSYPPYAWLHGSPLRVKPSPKQVVWLAEHWHQWHG